MINMTIGYQNVAATVAEIQRPFRCYVCGALPELVDVTQLGDAQPTYLPGRWTTPAVDHEHAQRPPTPDELRAAGDALYARMMEAW